MLRIAARKSLSHGKNLRLSSTQAAAPAKKGGLAKYVVGTTLAGTAGVFGYAYVDPSFRKQVEDTVPGLDGVFESVLGKAAVQTKKPTVAPLSLKTLPEPIVKTPEVVYPPLPPKKPVEVDPVDVRAKVVTSPTLNVHDQAARNQKLEASLKAAMQEAERKVHEATAAKLETIGSIKKHADVLKQTVDDAQNANWDNVVGALKVSEINSKKDNNAEADGRNFIDNLKTIIAHGKNNDSTSTNPLLFIATETANKLSYQLDEMNVLVGKARQESAVLNQYKDLIEQSRQQFALELQSILPNVDVNAKDKNLNEDELNALIAHAHLKVDQLRRQLLEQQVREEQHIAHALEQQKLADERIASEKLAIELGRISSQKELEIEKAVAVNRTSWAGELEGQLKRASSAHSEHLEQVIRTQRQLFEIENSQKVEEAILKERDFHSRQVGTAISKLEGIEKALGSRVALDNENRRAKQFWIACHNLLDTIKHGNKGGNSIEERRLPLADTLNLLQQVNPEDDFVNKVVESFPKVALKEGTYTEQDIKNRFETLYTVGRRTASVGVANNGTVGSYVWSYVKSFFLVDIPRNYAVDDQVDPSTIDNIQVLSRAKYYVDHKDFEKAIRVIQLLQGQSALIAQDWVKDVKSYLETQYLAQLLVAHAAVSSIRSTY